MRLPSLRDTELRAAQIYVRMNINIAPTPFTPKDLGAKKRSTLGPNLPVGNQFRGANDSADGLQRYLFIEIVFAASMIGSFGSVSISCRNENRLG